MEHFLALRPNTLLEIPIPHIGASRLAGSRLHACGAVFLLHHLQYRYCTSFDILRIGVPAGSAHRALWNAPKQTGPPAVTTADGPVFHNVLHFQQRRVILLFIGMILVHIMRFFGLFQRTQIIVCFKRRIA